MNEELIRIYKNYKTDNLAEKFDRLIKFANTHNFILEKYVFEKSLKAISNF